MKKAIFIFLACATFAGCTTNYYYTMPNETEEEEETVDTEEELVLVKQIVTYEDNEWIHSHKFQYDTSDRLSKVTIQDESSTETLTYTYSDSEITVLYESDWEGDDYDYNCIFRHSLQNGKLAAIYWEEEEVEHHFEYDSNGYLQETYSVEDGESYNECNWTWKNGNIFTRSYEECTYSYTYTQPYYPNKYSIDLNLFTTEDEYSRGWISNFVKYEGTYSEYMLKEMTYYEEGDEYHTEVLYSFDSNENITEITIYDNDSNTTTRHQIEY